MTGIKWQKPYTPRKELAKRPLGQTGGAPIPLTTIPLYLDEIDARDRRIAELEAALSGIFSTAYDPEGLSQEQVIESVIKQAAEAVGIKYPPTN